jgi:hypothetical protein
MRSPRLTRFVRTSLWLLLVSAVLCTVLVGAVMLWAAPFDGATLHVNGEQFTFSAPKGTEWLLALGGVLLALLVVLVVVPVAVFVPLLVGMLAMLVALFTVLGVLALLSAPLLLIGWIVWRLARSPSATRGPGATMGA